MSGELRGWAGGVVWGRRGACESIEEGATA